MINISTPTTNPSGFAMPIYGHQCALGKTETETAVVRDRALTGAVLGLAIGAFPGPLAWSPPH